MPNIPYGLIGTKTKATVPLEKIHVDVLIQGTTASLAAHFYYKNGEKKPIEAAFILPLESGISICEFRAEIDGRIVVGQVKEKEEAREIYDDAISSGQTAFLMEESIDSDDIFKISIGNLPPKKTARVDVTSVQTLKCLEDGTIHFVLPTILNPRYSPVDRGSEQFDDWSSNKGCVSVGGKYSFSLNVDICCGSRVLDVTSPTHQLNSKTEGFTANVKLDNIDKFHKDVEIIVKQEEPLKPFAFLELGDPASHDTFMTSPILMINYFPKDVLETNKKASPGEYIFVIDRSGSMGGDKIKDARESLVLFLKSLPPKSRFNIISFGSQFDFLYENGSQDYNDSNVTQACEFVTKMTANYGGTNILSPLKALFDQEAKEDLERRVFLLTDGEVSNTNMVIDLVKEKCSIGNTRCFALGIGHGASTSLVKGVAAVGFGVAEFARESSTTQQKVIGLLKYASRPCLNNVKINLASARLNCVRLIPTEQRFVTLGDSLLFYAEVENSEMIDAEKEIRLSFSVGKINFERVLSVQQNPAFCAKSKLVHCCAAKMLLSEMSQTASNKANAISLSKGSGVLSKFTAYIGVDENNREPITAAFHSLPKRPPLLWCAGALYRYAPLPQAPPRPPSLCHEMSRRSQHSPSPPTPPTPLRNEISLGPLHYPSPPPPPPRNDMSPRSLHCPPPPPPRNDMSPRSLHCPPPPPPNPISFMEQEMRDAILPDNGKRYMKLVSLQSVVGSWSLTSDVARELSTPLDNLEKAVPKYLVDQTNSRTLWCTVLVLAFLSSDQFASVKAELALVIEKAEKWLLDELEDTSYFAKLNKDAKITLNIGL